MSPLQFRKKRNYFGINSGISRFEIFGNSGFQFGSKNDLIDIGSFSLELERAWIFFEPKPNSGPDKNQWLVGPGLFLSSMN